MNPYRWARAGVAGFYRRHFTQLLLVRGRVEPGGTDAQCLFVGSGLTPRLLTRKVFSSTAEIQAEKRIRIQSLRGLLSSGSHGADLVVADLPLQCDGVFRGIATFTSRKRVRQVLDMSGSRFEDNKKLQAKSRETLRKIRKRGYRFRVSNDERDLKHFYDRMFVPHTGKQFGESARIESFEKLRAVEGWALAFVLESETAVAGAHLRFAGEVMEYRRMGVLDGDRAHVTNGAQAAVYYYMLQHAKERGLQRVDFLKSASWLNDGVYAAKRDWGADAFIDEDDGDTRLYYFNREGSDRLAAIYSRILPIVEDARGRLVGVVGSPGDESALHADLVRKYGGQGIRGILTVGRDGVIREVS